MIGDGRRESVTARRSSAGYRRRIQAGAGALLLQANYLYSREPGAISTRTTVWVDGVEHPVTVLTGSAVWVQLRPDAVRALAGDTPLSTVLRRVGVGRVRKDRSTPLEAAPDGMWMQGTDDDVVLVWRLLPESERLAFFRIGPLAAPCRILREQLLCGVVHIVAADDFLPRAGWQHLGRLVAERCAFGAIVSSRQEESEQDDARGAARAMLVAWSST